jgi:chitinase
VSPKDTANFLSFLKELRASSAGKKLFLTATGGVAPWSDADGNPSTSLGGFAKLLDYVAIMK